MASRQKPFWQQVSIPEPYRSMDYPALIDAYREKGEQMLLIYLLQKADGPQLGITAVIYSILKNHREDFQQELFLHLGKELQKPVEINNFPGWLRTMVRNRCLNFIKQAYHRRTQIGTDDLTETQGGQSNPKMSSKLDAERLLEKMQTAVSKEGWALIDCIASGRSYTDCADAHNLSFTAFRGRFQRARAKLIELFGKEYFEIVEN